MPGSRFVRRLADAFSLALFARQPALVLLACLVSGATLYGTASGRGGRTPRPLDIAYSQGMTISFPDGGGLVQEDQEGPVLVGLWSGPSSRLLEGIGRHGLLPSITRGGAARTGGSHISRAVVGRSRAAGEVKTVTTNVGCNFSISDLEYGNWDWTYEARIFDPGNHQIKYGQGWDNEKSGIVASLDVDLSDPIEGGYTCIVQWWVETIPLYPPQQITQNLSYTVPSGEYTYFAGWSTSIFQTVATWGGVLNGANYRGRNVTEATDWSDTDGCKAAANGEGPVPVFNGATGGTWEVGSGNQYGLDYIGWKKDAVDWYKSNVALPCETNWGQAMYINKPGNGSAQYATNPIRAVISSGSILVARGGQSESRVY